MIYISKLACFTMYLNKLVCTNNFMMNKCLLFIVFMKNDSTISLVQIFTRNANAANHELLLLVFNNLEKNFSPTASSICLLTSTSPESVLVFFAT